MPNSRTILVAALSLLPLVGVPSTASAVDGSAVDGGSTLHKQDQLSGEAVWGSTGDGSQYRVTVVNRSSQDVWITYYLGAYQFLGQAGTQCIPPGKSDYFSKASWASSNPQVRAEKKTAPHCGGSSTDDKSVGTVAEQDGSSSVTISDDGPTGISLSFAY